MIFLRPDLTVLWPVCSRLCHPPCNRQSLPLSSLGPFHYQWLEPPHHRFQVSFLKLVGCLVPRFQQSLHWIFPYACSQQKTLLPVSLSDRSQQRPCMTSVHLLYPLSIISVPSHWCLYMNWLGWHQRLSHVRYSKTSLQQVSLISCILRFSIYTGLSPWTCKHT